VNIEKETLIFWFSQVSKSLIFGSMYGCAFCCRNESVYFCGAVTRKPAFINAHGNVKTLVVIAKQLYELPSLDNFDPVDRFILTDDDDFTLFKSVSKMLANTKLASPTTLPNDVLNYYRKIGSRLMHYFKAYDNLVYGNYGNSIYTMAPEYAAALIRNGHIPKKHVRMLAIQSYVEDNNCDTMELPLESVQKFKKKFKLKSQKANQQNAVEKFDSVKAFQNIDKIETFLAGGGKLGKWESEFFPNVKNSLVRYGVITDKQMFFLSKIAKGC